MLRLKLLAKYSIDFNRHVSYLSSNFLNTINNTGWEQLSKNIFFDQNQSDIPEQLIKIRKGKDTTNIPIFSSFIIKQLLDTTSPKDLVNILCNRRDYGIFLDEFSGCYVLAHFLETNNYCDAKQVVIELINQKKLNNNLVIALAFKSIFEYLKISVCNSTDIDIRTDDNSAADVKLCRVKFLRNFHEKSHERTDDEIIGTALLSLCKNREDKLSKNFRVIGLLLCKQCDELEMLLKEIDYNDVLELCRTIVKTRNYPLENVIENNNSPINKALENLTDELDSNIKNCAREEESLLIRKHRERFAQWVEKYEQVKETQSKITNRLERIENIKSVIGEIETKQQNLWFFEDRDKIENECYKKKKYYPKKWFGKKKIPREMDNLYVPPDIIRRS